MKNQHLSVGYQSSPGNYINLFKSRKMEKSINKTSSNGSSFRITTTMFNSKTKSSKGNLSPTNLNSPFMKKRSLASTTSPDNRLNFVKSTNNNIKNIQSKDKLSTTLNQHEFKKIIYINEKTK